jgi:hypothetical protein
MPDFTLGVPEELHRALRKHTEIDWAEIACRAFIKEIKRLHDYEGVLQTSQLTEKDAIELGRGIRHRTRHGHR